jgi:hypothetical protein
MQHESSRPQLNENFRYPRSVQLAIATPSFVLWLLLSCLALIWCLSAAISAISGRLVIGDWRIPYLILIFLFVLVCSLATARTLWLAYLGRSPLWWHVCSFGLGIVLLGLIGIVGD